MKELFPLSKLKKSFPNTAFFFFSPSLNPLSLLQSRQQVGPSERGRSARNRRRGDGRLRDDAGGRAVGDKVDRGGPRGEERERDGVQQRGRRPVRGPGEQAQRLGERKRAGFLERRERDAVALERREEARLLDLGEEAELRDAGEDARGGASSGANRGLAELALGELGALLEDREGGDLAGSAGRGRRRGGRDFFRRDARRGRRRGDLFRAADAEGAGLGLSRGGGGLFGGGGPELGRGGGGLFFVLSWGGRERKRETKREGEKKKKRLGEKKLVSKKQRPSGACFSSLEISQKLSARSSVLFRIVPACIAF